MKHFEANQEKLQTKQSERAILLKKIPRPIANYKRNSSRQISKQV